MNFFREVHLVSMRHLETHLGLGCRPSLTHETQGSEAKRELRGSELDAAHPDSIPMRRMGTRWDRCHPPPHAKWTFLLSCQDTLKGIFPCLFMVSGDAISS